MISHRKASAKIRVIGKNGQAAANTKVHINQINHEFLFGCGAFDTLQLPQSQERMEKWLELFNYGTLPFYWGNYEPEEGKPHTDQLMAAAKYLKDRGVTVKGHPLCWHTVCAPWLMNYDNQTILKKQLERIHRDVI